MREGLPAERPPPRRAAPATAPYVRADVVEPPTARSVEYPRVPPAGAPSETDSLEGIYLETMSFTSCLSVTPDNRLTIGAVVEKWRSRAEGDTGDFDAHPEDVDLLAELEEALGAPEEAPAAGPALERISASAVVVRSVVSPGAKKSNFLNAFFVRKIPDTGVPAARKVSGPTVMFFRNGKVHGAGWKRRDEYEKFVAEVTAALGLPGHDAGSVETDLCNGSARIKGASREEVMCMKHLEQRMRDRGHRVRYRTADGHNGMTFKVVDRAQLYDELKEFGGAALRAARLCTEPPLSHEDATTIAGQVLVAVVTSLSDPAGPGVEATAVAAVNAAGVCEGVPVERAVHAAAADLVEAASAVFDNPKGRKRWERTAMVFSRGAVKLFARDEAQLARMIPVVDKSLGECI